MSVLLGIQIFTTNQRPHLMQLFDFDSQNSKNIKTGVIGGSVEKLDILKLSIHLGLKASETMRASRLSDSMCVSLAVAGVHVYLGQFVLSVGVVCQKQRVGPDSESGTGRDCCSTHKRKSNQPI